MAQRERLYRTEAVVLRRQDLGEADRLLTFLTPRRGKLRAVAKGVRRPRSRKAGHLEPFSRVDLLIARGRELDLVTQAEALAEHPHLSDDLMRLGQAAYLAELVDRFTLEDDPGDPGLYSLLVEMLSRLDDGDEPGGVVRYFELRLLDIVGYRPELTQCVGCGETVEPQDQFFSADQGGVLCPSCGSGHAAEARPLSLAALKVLRHYQRSPYEVARRPQIGAQAAEEVESLLEHYLAHLLERKLRVPAFVREVRQLTRRGT